MAKLDHDDSDASFRLWPAYTVAALRRKLLEALACGGSRHRHRCRRKKNGALSPESRGPLPRPGRSDRLWELLKVEASDSCSDEAAEAETRRKIEAFKELQRMVGRLQVDGDNEEQDWRKEAAEEVRRLTKDDSEARETLALLGAIPPLVGMLESKDPDFQIAALYALLNLGISNDLNKAAIVKAGAVHKMLNLLESGSSPASVSELIVANFLGLSALDSNKPIIGASGAIPFLLSSFQKGNLDASSTARQDALRSLSNLSIASSNVPHLIDAGLVPVLLAAIGDMAVSERALAVLSNLVASGEGRQAVSISPDAFLILVDVLGWSDAAGCQEKAVYVLMVMAHKAYGDRAKMIEAGVASALLELTLLGTSLAQKRASRLLEMLAVDKGKGVSEGGTSSLPAVSAPLYAAAPATEGEEELAEGMCDEKRAVKELVQQSLQSNMRRIVRRANLPQDFAPSERFRELTTSSTSKSLPF